MNVVIDSSYMLAIGQLHEIERGLMEGSNLPTDIYEALQAIVDRRFSETKDELIFGKYTPPLQQIQNLLQWDTRSGTYFGERRINEMAKNIPDFNWDISRPLRVLVLCTTRSTLIQTVMEKINIIKFLYGEVNVVLTESMNHIDEGNLYKVKGTTKFEPNHLWWEIIELGSGRYSSPASVDKNTACSTQLFDICCQHPAAILAQDGSEADPYWAVPGLRILSRDGIERVPSILVSKTGKITLCGDIFPTDCTILAEPVVVR